MTDSHLISSLNSTNSVSGDNNSFYNELGRRLAPFLNDMLAKQQQTSPSSLPFQSQPQQQLPFNTDSGGLLQSSLHQPQQQQSLPFSFGGMHSSLPQSSMSPMTMPMPGSSPIAMGSAGVYAPFGTTPDGRPFPSLEFQREYTRRLQEQQQQYLQLPQSSLSSPLPVVSNSVPPPTTSPASTSSLVPPSSSSSSTPPTATPPSQETTSSSSSMNNNAFDQLMKDAITIYGSADNIPSKLKANLMSQRYESLIGHAPDPSLFKQKASSKRSRALQSSNENNESTDENSNESDSSSSSSTTTDDNNSTTPDQSSSSSTTTPPPLSSLSNDSTKRQRLLNDQQKIPTTTPFISSSSLPLSNLSIDTKNIKSYFTE